MYYVYVLRKLIPDYATKLHREREFADRQNPYQFNYLDTSAYQVHAEVSGCTIVVNRHLVIYLGERNGKHLIYEQGKMNKEMSRIEEQSNLKERKEGYFLKGSSIIRNLFTIFAKYFSNIINIGKDEQQNEEKKSRAMMNWTTIMQLHHVSTNMFLIDTIEMK